MGRYDEARGRLRDGARAGPALLRGGLQPGLARTRTAATSRRRSAATAGARAVAGLRRRALQPGRRAGPLGPRGRRDRALAALPRARRRQSVGAHRARAPRSARAAGRSEGPRNADEESCSSGAAGASTRWPGRSPRARWSSTLWAAPGNPGIARHARCVRSRRSTTHDGLVRLRRRPRALDLVVVGPEAPLWPASPTGCAAAGLAVFGPGAARGGDRGLQGVRQGADGRARDPDRALRDLRRSRRRRAAYCRELGAPLVVKADGLAAGKGAIVCRRRSTTPTRRSPQCMERRAFGAAGATRRRRGVHARRGGVLLRARRAARRRSAARRRAGSQDRLRRRPRPQHRRHGRATRPWPRPRRARCRSASWRRSCARRWPRSRPEGAPYRGVLFVGLMLTARRTRRWSSSTAASAIPSARRDGARAGGDLVPLLARGRPRRAPGRPRHAVAERGRGLCERRLRRLSRNVSRRGFRSRGVEAAEARPGVQVFHAGTATNDGHARDRGRAGARRDARSPSSRTRRSRPRMTAVRRDPLRRHALPDATSGDGRWGRARA